MYIDCMYSHAALLFQFDSTCDIFLGSLRSGVVIWWAPEAAERWEIESSEEREEACLIANNKKKMWDRVSGDDDGGSKRKIEKDEWALKLVWVAAQEQSEAGGRSTGWREKEEQGYNVGVKKQVYSRFYVLAVVRRLHIDL